MICQPTMPRPDCPVHAEVVGTLIPNVTSVWQLFLRRWSGSASGELAALLETGG